MSVTVNGSIASKAALTIPSWGRWFLDVDLVEAVSLAEGAAVTGDFAGLALAGAVASGGVHNGRASYRIVGGRGKWGDALPARSYVNDAGVSLAPIARDAAAACGEVVDVSGLGSSRTGPHFSRASGPASITTLGAIAPRAWWVGLDGVTRFGSRPAVTYSGSAVRLTQRPAADVVDLAVEDARGLEPGAIVSPLTSPATDVELTLDGSKVTARVYGGEGRPSRRLQAWAWLLDALDPLRAYRASYEFRVISQEGERYNVQPVRSSSGLPEFRAIPVRSAAGVRATIVPGASVVVAFLDGDPSRPTVIAHDAAGAPGWMPTEISLGSSPRLGAVRLGDSVQAGPFSGVTTSASATTKIGI